MLAKRAADILAHEELKCLVQALCDLKTKNIVQLSKFLLFLIKKRGDTAGDDPQQAQGVTARKKRKFSDIAKKLVDDVMSCDVDDNGPVGNHRSCFLTTVPVFCVLFACLENKTVGHYFLT